MTYQCSVKVRYTLPVSLTNCYVLLHRSDYILSLVIIRQGCCISNANSLHPTVFTQSLILHIFLYAWNMVVSILLQRVSTINSILFQTLLSRETVNVSLGIFFTIMFNSSSSYSNLILLQLHIVTPMNQLHVTMQIGLYLHPCHYALGAYYFHCHY